MTCLIPLLFTILAPEPCGVWREMQEAWDKAQRMEVQIGYSTLPPLETLGPLTVVEEPGPFWIQGRQYLGAVEGGGLLRQPRLTFSRAHAESHGLFYHEMYHHFMPLVYWRWPQWHTVGHGGPDDPIRLRLEQLWFYNYPSERLRPAMPPVSSGEPLFAEYLTDESERR